MELRRGAYTMALFWFTWVPGCDRLLEMHCCASLDARGRWASRRIINELSCIVDHTRCRAVLAQVATPQLAGLCRTLGFEQIEQLAFMNLEKS